MSDIPAGRYRMRARTDRVGDGGICEIEDPCGESPDQIVFPGSALSDRNYSAGYFPLAEPGSIAGPVNSR